MSIVGQNTCMSIVGQSTCMSIVGQNTCMSIVGQNRPTINFNNKFYCDFISILNLICILLGVCNLTITSDNQCSYLPALLLAGVTCRIFDH